MQHQRFRLGTVLAGYLLLLSIIDTSGARAAPPPPLSTPSGERLELAAIAAAHPATVLVWWSSSCPCVRRYSERIRDLHARWAPRGVHFIAVASNADDDAKSVAAARARGDIPFEAALDRGGALARHFDIISTPTIVVLGPDAKSHFVGWLDNERAIGESGRKAWADDFLKAFLDGRKKDQRTPVWGCRITRRLSEDCDCDRR